MVWHIGSPHEHARRRRRAQAAMGRLAAGIIGVSLAAAPAQAALPGCTVAALAALGVPGVTITSAADVAATASVQEYCRVVGSVASLSGNPNRDGFGLDLPAGWNGRFLMTSGGGFVGNVNGPNTAAIARGFAVASTDTGHRGATSRGRSRRRTCPYRARSPTTSTSPCTTSP